MDKKRKSNFLVPCPRFVGMYAQITIGHAHPKGVGMAPILSIDSEKTFENNYKIDNHLLSDSILNTAGQIPVMESAGYVMAGYALFNG